ncbi:PH domain-containing protein [Sediminibacter sp. Hel_I_10]|uniref:PH domain-containing protein n=1 Tax=Sediminibacter sp. Hel_I_10 TaxID=1392490 RepID=UPI00047EC58F|nr:PH domain-containing protein [Sediminibacter sp. Hel_I_10]
MFTNLQIDLEAIPNLEDVVLKPISKRYLNVILVNKILLFGALYTALFLGKWFADDVLFLDYFWYLFLVLSIFVIGNIVVSVLAFYKRKYAIREKDVIYSKGLLVHKLTTVPISRIQHIEESRSWLARQFQLASIKIFTAGESGSDLSIHGLPEDEAAYINDFLSSKVNGDS